MMEKKQQVEEAPKQKVAFRKSLKELIKEKREAKMAAQQTDETLLIDDPYKPTYDFKKKTRKRTAYGYIPSVEHASPWDDQFPECPARAVSIHEAVRPILNRTEIIESKDLVDTDANDLLGLAHTPAYIEKVRKICVNASEEEAQLYDSIFYNGENSFKCAVQAVKMAVTITKLVAEGKFQNGFSNIRPPGHHATPSIPNGYCLFNNVAIAAKYMLNNNLAERIMIVDYDVHHGQGTQEIFYSTNKVLYFSIHRYEHGTFWPNLRESNFDYLGEKEGTGYNINVPLNETKLTDYDYLSIINNILLPVAYEFNPSLILVSAGYDACVGCPEGEMYVTPAFYGHLITSLSGLAEGKIVVILEGGYCIPSLADAGLRTLTALLGDPCHPLHHSRSINPSVCDTINNVKLVHRNYWKCFQVEPLVNIDDIYSYDRYNYHVVVLNYLGEPETAPFPTRGFYPLLKPSKQILVNSYIQFLQTERYNLRETIIGYMLNSNSNRHNPSANQFSQEVQARVDDIMNKLNEFGFIREMKNIEFQLSSGVPSIWDDVEYHIQKMHDLTYLSSIDNNSLPKKPDVYVALDSSNICRWSVSILCWLGLKIKENEITHGIGIIRPPGHHAKKAEAGGFCLINNIAVTADFLLKQAGLKRVLIVDFDVHHGDGTQQLTYERRDIMYISMHRHDNAKFFPKDKTGNYTYFGSGLGYGYNVNIPFNNEKMGNSDYLHTWIKVVIPLCYSYNPDIILVSAGFDAGINDPLGNYSVAPETFGHMIQILKPIAPIILALEGGYNSETTSLSMVNCVRALLGHPLPMPVLKDIKEETKKTIQNVVTVAKHYWPILQVNKRCDPDMRDRSQIDE